MTHVPSRHGDAPAYETSGPSLKLVVGVLTALAVGLGVWAFASYSRSEVYLHASFEQIHAQGVELDAEGCISATLAWHQGCEAMKSLCDHAVPMVANHCLAAKDRAAYCDEHLDRYRVAAEDPDAKAPDTAQWTYEMCFERGVTKKTVKKDRKACTAAYRAIDSFCKSGQQGVML